MPKIVVLGGGESGCGAAVLARVKGFDVFLSDMGVIAPKYKALLAEWNVPYEEGRIRPADTRCRPGRQEPRHSRQGADDEGGPRTRNSGRVRNRVRRPVHIGPHDLRHGQQRQDDHDDADLRDSAPRGRERRFGRQHRPEFRAVGRHGAARLVRNRAEQLSARPGATISGPTSGC